MATITLLRLSIRLPTTAHQPRHNSQSPFHHPLQPHLSSKFLTPKIHLKPIKNPTKTNTIIAMSSSTTPATDRLISAVAYFLPFINNLHYGRYLFAIYPPLSLLFDPFIPILTLYKTVPYAFFVVFFGLYIGVVRNPGLSDYVRFNAMQALVLDVLLVLPTLLQRIFNPGRTGVEFMLMVWGHSAVFVFVVFCFVYSFVSCVVGKTPYLPFVTNVAGG